ncbi:MAG: DNA polymerase III subunit delta [Verrucomicrobiota bacterium]|nr:DNA polymerase III subunit delta [Verrucomicrobiota bacterium]MEE2813784.1 DNA polymerase III subunit delta [Verrucomicrobiota bacterium]
MSKEIPKGPLAFIYGDDEFAVSQRARQIYQKWCEEDEGEDNEIVEAQAATAGEASKALGRLNEAMETLPFFGGGKVIWFKACNYLGDDRTAKANDVSQALADLATKLKTFDWSGVRLVVSSSKADKRKSFYKTASKVGYAEEFAALSLDDRDWQAKAEQLIGSRLKLLKKKADYSTVNEIAQLVGPDARAIVSECDKLAAYVGRSAEITVKDVRSIVTQGKHAKAFALGDALGERNLTKLLKRLDEDLWAAKTNRKKSVIGLVAGLVGKVRSLLFARELLDAGWIKPVRGFAQFKSQIESLSVEAFAEDRRISPLGLHPYVLFSATNQAQNYTREELVVAMDLLMHCNHKLVSTSLDESFVLQQVLTQIVVKEARAA